MHSFLIVVVLGMLFSISCGIDENDVWEESTINGSDGEDDAQNKSTAASLQKQLIYLNRRGVVLTPGSNDSRSNQSSLIKETVSIPAWKTSVSDWNEVVTCVKDMFLPFNVEITDNDPGDVSHVESVIGGLGANLGEPKSSLGLAPFNSTCDVIPNAIVFTFVESFESVTPRHVCEITVQEIAHAFGLDHQMLCTDPMSYLECDEPKMFQDEFSSCGEREERSCKVDGFYDCGRTVQNSYQELSQKIGLKDGTVFPELKAKGFKQGDFVLTGDTLEIETRDDTGIAFVEFALENTIERSDTPPYFFQIPLDTNRGNQTLSFKAVDHDGNESDLFVDVLVENRDGKGVKHLLPSDDASESAIGGCNTSSKQKPSVFGCFLMFLLVLSVWERKNNDPKEVVENMSLS